MCMGMWWRRFWGERCYPQISQIYTDCRINWISPKGPSMCRRLLVCSIVAAVAASGADWPQFRGPGGSGVSGEAGLPASWSSKENIVWRTKLPGPGTSSPIVVGKRVYLTCYSGYGLEDDKGDMDKLMRHLVCIDRAKGDILWTKDFKPLLPESRYAGSHDTQHGYASSTPASDGKRLYLF